MYKLCGYDYSLASPILVSFVTARYLADHEVVVGGNTIFLVKHLIFQLIWTSKLLAICHRSVFSTGTFYTGLQRTISIQAFFTIREMYLHSKYIACFRIVSTFLSPYYIILTFWCSQDERIIEYDESSHEYITVIEGGVLCMDSF